MAEMNIWDEFDKTVDLEGLRADIEEAASGSATYKEVPHGEYEVKIEKMELKLSKSYKLRADIEIATLLNKVLGIKTPMFVDDVESITGMKLPKDTQIIMAIVVKFNELEILDSYSEVLEREKRSIDKKIEENSNQLMEAA